MTSGIPPFLGYVPFRCSYLSGRRQTDLSLQAVALTLKGNEDSTVKDPVDGGIGQDRVREDLCPLFNIPVRG